MSEVLEDVVSLIGDGVSVLFDWFLDFFKGVFSGRSIANVGRSVIDIFLVGKFDFDLKSIFELLFGIVFIIFAFKMLVHIIRG